MSVLDNPGADSENLSWDQVRIKETEHFIVKTNLSVDALNDICFILGYAYFTYQDMFGFDTPKEKLRVMVAKNKDEYPKIYYDLTGTNLPPSTGGRFIPASWSKNKSRQNQLLCYYQWSKGDELSGTLLHECTHYAMELVRVKYGCFNPPIWLNEGWATYYGTSSLEGKRLVTNVINEVLLPYIKAVFNNHTYIKLKDFINLSPGEYNAVLSYAQGWGLVYFLLNGQGGKYKTGLQAYMEAWKKGKIVMVLNKLRDNYLFQDKPGHLKLFEKCMGVPIDQLEQEWKEYILQLK